VSSCGSGVVGKSNVRPRTIVEVQNGDRGQKLGFWKRGVVCCMRIK
jgi:hypothetical protein